jgi:hypothetical protein
LSARLVLRLVAEWKPETVEVARIDPRQHVRLVLGGIGTAGHESAAPVQDDPRVVARRKEIRSRPASKAEQLCEAKRSVAAGARIRRLAAGVAADERVHDRLDEAIAHVQRDVRQPERMARLPRRDDGLRRAAGPGRVRPLGIEPEA